MVDRQLGELLDGRDQRAAAGVAGPPVELGTGRPPAPRAAFASSVARPYAELILWGPLPSARATKESRGIEIATARAFGPAGTCSRMIVSVCSWPSSTPARSSASSSGGRGLPDASVRLSSPTRSAVNGCSGSGASGPAADDVARDDAVGQRPLDRPAVPGADQQRERQHRGDRAPDRAGDQAQQAGDSAHRTRPRRAARAGVTDRSSERHESTRPGNVARGCPDTSAARRCRRGAPRHHPDTVTAVPDIPGTVVTPS